MGVVSHPHTHTHVLTHDAEPKGLGNFGLRRHLALVRARVPGLGRSNPQRPLVAALGVQRLKPLVVRVRQDADGQDVQVALTDPGHLGFCVKGDKEAVED